MLVSWHPLPVARECGPLSAAKASTQGCRLLGLSVLRAAGQPGNTLGAMSDALITAIAALIGAFGGVSLSRLWQRLDDVRSRRREWSVEVMKFLDWVGDIGRQPRPRATEIPKPPTELEVDDPTAVTLHAWVRMRSYQFLSREADAQVKSERERDISFEREMASTFAYHRETKEVFARWGRGALRSRFRRYENEMKRTPENERGFY